MDNPELMEINQHLNEVVNYYYDVADELQFNIDNKENNPVLSTREGARLFEEKVRTMNNLLRQLERHIEEIRYDRDRLMFMIENQ